MLGPSAHIDTFSRDNLPPREQWPDLLLAGFDYTERLNVGVELTDRMVQKGFGDSTALIGNGRRRTYKELTDWTNRLARALVENYGVRPGNRVLVRSANNPAMVVLAGRDQGGCRRGQHRADAACGASWRRSSTRPGRPADLRSATCGRARAREYGRTARCAYASRSGCAKPYIDR